MPSRVDGAAAGRRPSAAMTTRPDLAFERAAVARGARRVAGVDEVGRGPWAGPVVAGAVRLTAAPPAGLDDSKRLSRARREALVGPIEAAADWALGAASAAEIDRLGLGPATRLAMARAVAGLGEAPDHLLVDGTGPHPWAPCPHETIVRGDSLSASIAAASVLAKVARDRLMAALARRHPGYGWERNVGYGTPAHRAGLAALGVTIHHRRSFAPVRAMLPESPDTISPQSRF